MDVLRVTVVGQDLFGPVKEKFELAGINKVNQLNNGMLGNLKTLTYALELPMEELIDTRRKLMDEMAKDNNRMMPMYVHGDWMRIFVFKTIRG